MPRHPVPVPWARVVITSANTAQRKRIERAVARGELTALGHGIYVRVGEDPASALADHWPDVVRQLTNAKGHVSHRTALHFNPYSPEWFVSWPMKRYRTVTVGPKRIRLLAGMPEPETSEMYVFSDFGNFIVLI